MCTGNEWERQKAALDYIEKNYRQEQDLYWKRSTYFWTLLAAIFVGFTSIRSDATLDETAAYLKFIIIMMGCFFSYAWHLVSRSSRYWHRFWLHRLIACESRLYGETLDADLKDEIKGHPLDQYHFSSSAINQTLSLLVSCIWAGIFVHEISQELPNFPLVGVAVVFTVGGLVLMTYAALKKAPVWKSIRATYQTAETNQRNRR